MADERTMVYPDVLIVAPDGAGLNTVPEVDTISELGFRVRVLQGMVDDERLYRAVQDHRYDLIHFACHGSLDSLGVSNGGTLGRNAVLQVVRMSAARIVFLNACSSSQLGQVLVNSGLPVAIASIMDVKDDIARQTAQTFYTILAQTNDVSMAYRAACAGGDVYYNFLTNGSYAALQAKPVLDELAVVKAALLDSQTDEGKIHGDLRRLSWMVACSSALSVAALLTLIAHVVR